MCATFIRNGYIFDYYLNAFCVPHHGRHLRQSCMQQPQHVSLVLLLLFSLLLAVLPLSRALSGNPYCKFNRDSLTCSCMLVCACVRICYMAKGAAVAAHQHTGLVRSVESGRRIIIGGQR